MEFHNHRTAFQWFKSAGQTNAKTHDQFAVGFLQLLEEQSWQNHGKPLAEVDPFTPTQLSVETKWANERMPYYNLYPGIIPALTKLRMDVDCEHFTLPLPVMLIRLPQCNHALTFTDKGKDWSVKTIMASAEMLQADLDFGRSHGIFEPQLVPAITFWIDIDERVDESVPVFRRLMYKHLLKLPGWSIERCFEEIPEHQSVNEGVEYPMEIVRHCARIVCTLCLMAEDPEIVQPDVLAADRSKYAARPDPALVDKAHRRGKVGWNVGANIEVSPHLRSASPAALYWTGEGRKIPRIRFRKGCVVHRRKLTSVPTGYLSDIEGSGDGNDSD